MKLKKKHKIIGAILITGLLISGYSLFFTKKEAIVVDDFQAGGRTSNFWKTSGNTLLTNSSYDIKIPSLSSCDTIDTDFFGNLSCGVDGGGAGGSINQLGQIGDVSTTTLAEGYILKYTSGVWESAATSSLGISGGGITEESDPIWNASSSDYYTSSQIDGFGYLTSYTESDPVWIASSSDYVPKSGGTMTGQLTMYHRIPTTDDSVILGKGAGAGDDQTNNDMVVIGYNAGNSYTNQSVNSVLIGSEAGDGGSGMVNDIIIGRRAGRNVTGDNNVIIGSLSGNGLTSGAGNVLLGYYTAGSSGNFSNRLYISNTNDTTPLIYGEFDTNALTVNGTLTATGNLTTNVTGSTQCLQVDTNGLLSGSGGACGGGGGGTGATNQVAYFSATDTVTGTSSISIAPTGITTFSKAISANNGLVINGTTLLAGTIQDYAYSLGSAGEFLQSDGSGHATWQPEADPIWLAASTSYLKLTGGTISGDLTVVGTSTLATTTIDDLTVSGTAVFTTPIADGSISSAADWNTAFGWGNHAGLYDVLGQATSTLDSHTTDYNHANFAVSGGAFHDGFSDFVSEEHTDWRLTTQGTIHATNYVDNTDDSVSASELTLDYGDFTCNGTTCTLDDAYLTTIPGSTGQSVFFSATDTLTATSSMTIDTNGYIGIGTTSPAYKLDVYGNARVDGTLKVGAYTLPATDSTSGYVLKTDGVGGLTWQEDLSGGDSFSTTTNDYWWNNTTGITPSNQITAGTAIDWSSNTLNVDVTGDWTGTFDTLQGSAYLDRSNHTGTQATSTITGVFEDANIEDTLTCSLYLPLTGGVITASSTVTGDFTVTATTTTANLVIDSGVTATSTMSLGDVGNVGCLKVRDSDDAGWSYATLLNGVISWSSTSCE